MIDLKEQYRQANAFEVEGNATAALLIHGFTGTPAELRDLGFFLNQEFGWTIHAPLLPGHGTTPENLAKVKMENWAQTTHGALRRLSKKHAKIHLIGISMGALLCIQAFDKAKFAISSLALLVPALYLKSFQQRWGTPLMRLPGLARLMGMWPKERKIENLIAYEEYPLLGVRELHRLQQRIKKLPPQKSPPLFLCYSEKDDVVHPRSIPEIKKILHTDLSKTLPLKESHHVITIGPEKEKLFSEMREFYRSIT